MTRISWNVSVGNKEEKGLGFKGIAMTQREEREGEERETRER